MSYPPAPGMASMDCILEVLLQLLLAALSASTILAPSSILTIHRRKALTYIGGKLSTFPPGRPTICIPPALLLLRRPRLRSLCLLCGLELVEAEAVDAEDDEEDVEKASTTANKNVDDDENSSNNVPMSIIIISDYINRDGQEDLVLTLPAKMFK